MGLLLTNNRRTLWAAESAYDTDAVEADILTDGDADLVWQQVRSLDITPEGAQVGTNRLRGSHSGTKHAFIKGRCAISGEIPLTPYISGSAQVPYSDAILQACNLIPDLSTPSESTYSPKTVNSSSATIYQYHRSAEDANWRLQVVTGARFTPTFQFGVGEEPFIALDGGGTYTRITDEAAFVDSSGAAALLKDGSTPVTARAAGTELVADQAPLTCSEITITIGGTQYVCANLELALNWDVGQKEAITGAEQTVKHVLTRADTRIGGSFSLVDYTAAALTQLLEDYEDDSEVSATIVCDNGTDEVTFTMPKMQFGVPAGSDNGGTLNFDVPFFLNGNWSSLAGDNDFTILFDAV